MTQQLEKQSRTLAEQYELLRKTLAHYLLLQVSTFVTAVGYDAIGPAMQILTDKKAELKVREIRERGQTSPNEAVVALSENLAESMGETFQSDYDTEIGDKSRTVRLSQCGCIESVTAQAEAYGLTRAQARSIFCGTCMSSYKKAAEGLGLGFSGRLRGEHGCSMSFSTKQPNSQV
jgi:hypothetical protein